MRAPSKCSNSGTSRRVVATAVAGLARVRLGDSDDQCFFVGVLGPLADVVVELGDTFIVVLAAVQVANVMKKDTKA